MIQSAASGAKRVDVRKTAEALARFCGFDSFCFRVRGAKQSYSCSSVVLGVALGAVLSSVARFREAFLLRSFEGLAVPLGDALGVVEAAGVAVGYAVALGEAVGVGETVAVGVALGEALAIGAV